MTYSILVQVNIPILLKSFIYLEMKQQSPDMQNILNILVCFSENKYTPLSGKKLVAKTRLIKPQKV